MAYSAAGNKRRRFPRPFVLILASLLVIALVGVAIVRHVYYQNLLPVSGVQQSQVFDIKPGNGVKEIANNLKKDHLIRSSWAFEWYVGSKGLGSKVQAGTFALSPSEDTQTIVALITKGRVNSQLVTILPGRRIDQVRADLINYGFAPADVDNALNPAQYADLPVIKDVKPAKVTTLEGLLWPDSWDKDAATPPSQIIRQSLEAMGEHLTPDAQSAFHSEGLTTYQGLILSSIIIQEVNRPSDQTQAAQVFLSRLKTHSTLGSDVTTRYGAIAAGQAPNLTYDSAYNTHLHAGLPPTPISTISASSLYAATHPANTHWLYFVAGDNGITYFATSLQQHNAQTEKYCHRLCSQ